MSLVGSLEEYLKDPNFDKNRREYKRNNDIAEGRTPVRGRCFLFDGARFTHHYDRRGD